MAIQLIDTVTPVNNQPYPIVYSDDVRGGYHSVNSLEERDAIPMQRRQANMLVYVNQIGMFRLDPNLSTWISADNTATFEMEVDGEITDEYSLSVNINEVSNAYKSVYENLYSQFKIMFQEMQRTIDVQQRKINELEVRIFALESGMGELPDISYDDVIIDYDGLPLIDYNGYAIDDYDEVVIEKYPYIVDYDNNALIDYKGNVIDDYNIFIEKDANAITDYSGNSMADYNGQPFVDYGNVIYLTDYKNEYLTDYDDNKIFMKEGVV